MFSVVLLPLLLRAVEDSRTGKETPSPVGSLDYSTQAGKQGKVVKSFSVLYNVQRLYVNNKCVLQYAISAFFWPLATQINHVCSLFAFFVEGKCILLA